MKDCDPSVNLRQMSNEQNVLQKRGSVGPISASNRTRGDRHIDIPRRTSNVHSIVWMRGSDGPIEVHNRTRGVDPGEGMRMKMKVKSGEVPIA